MASYQGMLTLALTVVLLALPSLTYGETLYVRPTSTNISCSMHPCHTLSEYAQHSRQYFNDSNLTLQFLPGNHSLSVNVTIASIHQMEILGNSSAVVPTRVICSFRVGFTFTEITEVRMNGLAFVACAKSHVTQIGRHRFTTYYGLHLQSVHTAEIIDCTFQDSYGSALGVVDSHVVLRGCSFLRNCRHCSNGRCGIWGPTCYGGGVFADKSNLIFTGSNKFLHNSAKRYGGGVYAVSNSNVKISGNTTFVNNSASLHGGGLYAVTYGNTTIIGNTTFIGNSANEYGGGVYTWSNLNISENTTFIDNSATRGGGVNAGSVINISGNTTFSGNSVNSEYSDDCGGGVYIGSNSNAKISGNTMFIDNSARDGGGVFVNSRTNVNICGNTAFIRNSALHGGGIYSKTNNNVNISGNTKFINNSATDDGGGVYSWFYDNVNISGNTTFIANVARNGGGFYLWHNNSLKITGNATFTDNSASKFGGGVCSWPNSATHITGNTNFIGNLASYGGGVYVQSNCNVNISENTTFIENSAKRDGGGVYAGSNSSVIISGNTIFCSNSAIHGGGGGFVESSLSLEGYSRFTHCSATVGGAIYAERTQLLVSGTNAFNANRAEHFGGGLYAHNSTLNFPGESTFTTNSAGSRGGGIYAQETKITFSGTGLLCGNMAQLDGGGIYADSSNLTFWGIITIRNSTAQLGGGVYSDNNTFNIEGFSVFERNVATYYGGGIYTQRSPLTLAGNNNFIANSAGEGGGIYATANSTLNLDGVNTFMANRAYISGGGIWLDNSILALNGASHLVECVASYEGGAIFMYATTASLHGNITFESNSATTGGGIHARWSKVSVTDTCDFIYNIAGFGGGIFADNNTFEFKDLNTFRGNQANHTGGGIYVARSVLNFLGVSSVTANRATRDGGGIYTRDDCVVNLLGLINYQNNSAGDTGGGISAFQSNFNLSGKSTFNRNHAVEGGGFYAFKSTVNSLGENYFNINSASFYGGGLIVIHCSLHLNGSTSFKNNSAASGGGMYIGDSTVHSDGSNCFINNTANSGGGMYTRDSVVKFNGRDLFVANSARRKGAAIHVSFTILVFQGSSSFVNNSAEYGGGIHSESGSLTFLHHYTPPCISYKSVCNDSVNPESIFLNNTALRGGAQYLDLYSNFSLHKIAQVHFRDNHATEFGGAIYAADVSGPGQFLSQQPVPFRRKCFFHIFGNSQSLDLDTPLLVFVNNTAGIRGSVLYGGLLDKCDFTSNRYMSALELFNMSIVKEQRKDEASYSISSDPAQLCLCNMKELNCREVTHSRSIYPGQYIMLSVTAIDQSGLAIPTLIHTNIRSGPNLTVSETISYKTGSNCTSRNYSVTPKNHFNQLELYPTNRSGSAIHLIVNITFKSCPFGFEQSNFTGECICDHRLWQYTNSCDIDRQAILQDASRTFWLGVWYNNGTPEGFIHHPYCPLDYCTRESRFFSLKSPNKQCNSNRSGLLCGKCKEGLSLVLGSSQCKECSNNYLALLIPFALAGVLLVILLLLLHLTVTAGTLHGLIFYANIVAANHHIFFPQTPNNPASIFIAWLNLDLGIQTCFYNGMDAYSKTWLGFLFPVYIWVIVGLLVYISHYSVTVTKILGSSPVPVLATLFLLSYAKILRTIISALSLTILYYPHKNVVVWMHDANVSLAKYIPLVLVALLFLLFLFLPYTLLLLLGQWLQAKSYFPLLHWVRNPKLKAILDTYHAPYKPNHRFWTGLLLLLRCVFFLVFAFNINRDDSVNLLIISSSTFGILGWLTLFGVVYKSWYLNALEVSFIINLGILAVATYHVNHVNWSGGSQIAVAYTSVAIAFLTFMGIITYHIYVRIKSKVQYIQRGNQLQCGINKCQESDYTRKQCHQPGSIPTVTHTEVSLRELRPPLDLLPPN